MSRPPRYLDELMANSLQRTQPALYQIVRDIVAAGADAGTIGAVAERQAGVDSSVPGLCEATARHLRRKNM